MNNKRNNELKELLEKFKVDKTAINIIRSKYQPREVFKVAIEEKMDDVIYMLFHPIKIGDEYIIAYDFYSILSGTLDYEERQYLERMPSKIDIPDDNIRKVKLKNSLAREISGWSHPINDEKGVAYFAEPACLDTMLYLYRNNITTTMNDTECVYGDHQEKGICTVWFLYETLSDENKEIAHRLIRDGFAKFIENEKKKTISIYVQCSEDDTIQDVSDKLLNIAKKFKKQINLKGLLTEDELINILVNPVRGSLYNDTMIPNSSESFIELFYSYIDEGLLRTVELSDDDYTYETENIYVQTEDEKIYSIIDFIKIIKELRPESFEDMLERMSIYHDNKEDNYWLTEKDYKNYINSKKQLAISENHK